MFRNAIVRTPSRSITDGLSTSGLGKPVYSIALEQHEKYTETLRKIGLKVRVLPSEESFPDSTFIEDVALCTTHCAIITRPGAESRRGETDGMKSILREYYSAIDEVVSPGTLEAGDVMMVGKHFYIGISNRTNVAGADQLIHILEKYNLTGSKVPLKKMLHLKSGASYLENNIILAAGEFRNDKIFDRFTIIEVDDNERYAANSLWINGRVIVAEGFPETRAKIEKAGFETITLDVSEFRKVDGGLSCISLRF
jgi:dimethylargininase